MEVIGAYYHDDETRDDLNRIWGKFDKEISSKKTEIPDWTLDEMLAMKWYFPVTCVAALFIESVFG